MRHFLTQCIAYVGMILVVFYGVGVNVLPLCCLEEHECLKFGEKHYCHHCCLDDSDECEEHHCHHHGPCCQVSRLSLQLSDIRTTNVHLDSPDYTFLQSFFPVFLRSFDNAPRVLEHFAYYFRNNDPPRHKGRLCLLQKSTWLI